MVNFSAHADEPWGIEVDFDAEWTQWRVTKTEKDQQAEKLGIQPNDRIIAVNGIEIQEDNFNSIREGLYQGTQCEMTLQRTIKEVTFSAGNIGIRLRGNTIIEVQEKSQAEKIGIKIGWIIINVNGKTQSNDHRAIAKAIKTTNKERKPTTIMLIKANEVNQDFEIETKQHATEHKSEWELEEDEVMHDMETDSSLMSILGFGSEAEAEEVSASAT